MRIHINQNVDLLPVFFTAFLILSFIKISGILLPTGYYFSVSSIFKTNTELMLVQDQGLPAAKLCELLKKNYIEPDDIDLQQQNCDQLTAANKNFAWGAGLPNNEREEIYETWVSKRTLIESVIENSIKELAEKDENTDNQENENYNGDEIPAPTVNQIARNISYDLTTSSLEGLFEIIGENLSGEFSDLENKHTVGNTEENEVSTVEFQGIPLQLNPDEIEKIRLSAKTAALSMLREKQFAEILRHPKTL